MALPADARIPLCTRESQKELSAQGSNAGSNVAGSSSIQSTLNTQFSGGSFTSVGRDIIINHHHSPQQSGVDVLASLRSSSLPNYRKMQLDTFNKVTKGTGLWFANGQVLHAWIRDGKILWGTGMPGAGKTYLMSIVVHELQKRAQSSSGEVFVAYVYIRYSEPLPVRDILEALLKQIVERHQTALDVATPLYTQHHHDQTQPTQRELLSVLSDICNLPGAFFLLVDGLDEMALEDALALAQGLASLRARLFITSRSLDDLAAKFPSARFFTIVAQRQDINLLVEEAVARSVDLGTVLEDPAFRAEVTRTIHSTSQGMFLHAALQLDALRECLSVQDAKEVLDDFPKSIDDIYSLTWERICRQTAKRAALAQQVLLWVLHAKRDMSMEELRHALATSPELNVFQRTRLVSPATIISACYGLVVVDSERKVVRLVHYTARDTLMQRVVRIHTDAHGLLTSVCLTHLVTCGLQTSPSRRNRDFDTFLRNDPLLHYAYRSWYYHAQLSLQRSPTPLQDIIQFIHGCKTYPLKWHRHMTYVGPFHVAAYYGFPEYFALHKASKGVGAATTWNSVTPLVLAAFQGHEECVKEILCSPHANVNAQDFLRLCAISAAAKNNHTAVVDLLLRYPGINVNLSDILGYTPLLLSSAFVNEDIVRKLLQVPNVQVNAILQAPSGWSSLMLACRNRYQGIVNLLLAHPDIDPNLAEPDSGSALIIACANGHEAIVKLLLAHPRVDVNLATEDRFATLATKYGRGRIQYRENTYMDRRELEAAMLAEHPGQLTPIPDGNWTALMHASKNGNEAIVRCLLAIPRIQVNTASGAGQTALSLALKENHAGVVKLLLDHPGIDRSFVTLDGITPQVRGEIEPRP